jgi:hypothetical protein
MGRVELKHYPASKLPAELRGAIGLESIVSILVEEEAEATQKPLTGKDLKQFIETSQRNNKGVSIEEAVRRIRELRDEWDD